MSACLARQYSDQMLCGICGLAWDVNDPEPPECKTVTDNQPFIVEKEKVLE